MGALYNGNVAYAIKCGSENGGPQNHLSYWSVLNREPLIFGYPNFVKHPCGKANKKPFLALVFGHPPKRQDWVSGAWLRILG